MNAALVNSQVEPYMSMRLVYCGEIPDAGIDFTDVGSGLDYVRDNSTVVRELQAKVC